MPPSQAERTDKRTGVVAIEQKVAKLAKKKRNLAGPSLDRRHLHDSSRERLNFSQHEIARAGPPESRSLVPPFISVNNPGSCSIEFKPPPSCSSDMASNIEIKARAPDLDSVEQLVSRHDVLSCETLHQEDVFFHCPRGRLKLRIFAPDRGELIYYERPDAAEAKQSYYEIAPTAEPKRLRTTLAAALGERVVVKKRRRVYLAGQTRIHLDEVEGLGSFVELEVVLREGQTAADGRRVMQHWMERLEISPEDLVPCAYADLLSS